MPAVLSKPIRWFVELNLRLSDWMERAATKYTARQCGMTEFDDSILPRLLKPGLRVLDVGGGKQPRIDVQTKRKLGLYVVGLDISRDELQRAPVDAYDRTIVGDVAKVKIDESFDLILSHTVLEHVPENRSAMHNLAAALADGAVMAHHVPCSNAPYAIVNRLLGPKLSRKVLLAFYPDRAEIAGFDAYYDHCTPRKMRKLCEQNGLHVSEMIPYYASDYLRFCAPVFAVDLLRQLGLMWIRALPAAETFTFIACKPSATHNRRHQRAA
jgi:SAM-dependent methyltransferase